MHRGAGRGAIGALRSKINRARETVREQQDEDGQNVFHTSHFILPDHGR
jgi:hypothetical protein